MSTFRDEPRGPDCQTCYGTGTCSDRNGNDPSARDVECGACDGSGLACEQCRFSKNGICQECSMEAVEFLFEGTL
jgi:hypothetical protein